MTESTHYTDKDTGRWYSLKIKLNIPRDMVQYYDATKKEYVDFTDIEGLNDDEIRVWVKREDLLPSSGSIMVAGTATDIITLKNKYIDITTANKTTEEVKIKLTQTEKSALIQGTDDKESDDKLSTYYINRDAMKIKNQDELDQENAEKLARNNNGTTKKDISLDKDGVYKIDYNVTGAEKLTYNGINARWALIHVSINDGTHIVSDTMNSSNNLSEVIYVDYAHASNLLDTTGASNASLVRVPVWINLDEVGKTPETATTIKLTSRDNTTAVEETREYKIYVADTYELPEGVVLPENNEIGSIDDLLENEIPDATTQADEAKQFVEAFAGTTFDNDVAGYIKAINNITNIVTSVEGNVITMDVYGPFNDTENFKVKENGSDTYIVPIMIKGVVPEDDDDTETTGAWQNLWVKGHRTDNNWHQNQMASDANGTASGVDPTDLILTTRWNQADMKDGAKKEIYLLYTNESMLSNSRDVTGADDYIKIVLTLHNS